MDRQPKAHTNNFFPSSHCVLSRILKEEENLKKDNEKKEANQKLHFFPKCAVKLEAPRTLFFHIKKKETHYFIKLIIQFIRLGFFRLAVMTLFKIRKRKRVDRKLPQLFLEKIKKPIETRVNDTPYYPMDPILLRKDSLEI